MTPNRTTPGPLLGRMSAAAFAAAIAIAARQSVVIISVVGMIGALGGTFGGYYARSSLIERYGIPDFAIALTEDLVAVNGAFCLVRQIV